MDQKKAKGQTYRSMVEFEKRFFPKSFEKRMAERPKDANALGISLAKESLDKIKVQLPL